MATQAATAKHTDHPAEPAWEIARLFPAQGYWSEEEYLGLETNHLVEFSEGRVEVLPMPTDIHQTIVGYLFTAFLSWVQRFGGKVLFAPFRVRLWPGKFREPDLVLMLAAHDDRRHDQYWDGADLVVEVVSADDPERDLVLKRQEYAQADIPEYWIVDPQTQTIRVLHLEAGRYTERGPFKRGEIATSVLLEGLRIDVAAVFDAN